MDWSKQLPRSGYLSTGGVGPSISLSTADPIGSACKWMLGQLTTAFPEPTFGPWQAHAHNNHMEQRFIMDFERVSHIWGPTRVSLYIDFEDLISQGVPDPLGMVEVVMSSEEVQIEARKGSWVEGINHQIRQGWIRMTDTPALSKNIYATDADLVQAAISRKFSWPTHRVHWHGEENPDGMGARAGDVWHRPDRSPEEIRSEELQVIEILRETVRREEERRARQADDRL